MQLIWSQESVLRRIKLQEHIFQVRQLALLHFECWKKRDNTCLESGLLSKGCHVFNHLVRSIFVDVGLFIGVLKPTVIQSWLGSDARGWVFLETSCYELDCFWRKALFNSTKSWQTNQDWLMNLIFCFSTERRLSWEKNMSNDTNGPHIDSFVVRLFEYQFWCHIEWWAQNLFQTDLWPEKSCKPEISQLYVQPWGARGLFRC